MLVRNAIVERLKALPQFIDFNIMTDASHQVQPYEVPYIGVYLMPEQMNYEGDWNVTEPHYSNDFDIGLSVIMFNNAGDDLEIELDNAFDLITKGLLCDQTFMSFAAEHKIEGVKKIDRSHQFGTVGSSNQMPIGELRMTWTFAYHTYFSPTIIDDLELIVIRTAYPNIDAVSDVQQILFPVRVATVGPLATDLTITPSVNPSTVGQPVDFFIKVTSHDVIVAVGDVSIKVDGTTVTPIPLRLRNGVVTWTTDTLPAGMPVITVDYIPQDVNTFSPTSTTVTQTVNP